MQNRLKMSSEPILDIDAPGQPRQCRRPPAQIFGDQFQLRPSRCRERIVEEPNRLVPRPAICRSRHNHGGFASRTACFHETSYKRSTKAVHAFAAQRRDREFDSRPIRVVPMRPDRSCSNNHVRPDAGGTDIASRNIARPHPYHQIGLAGDAPRAAPCLPLDRHRRAVAQSRRVGQDAPATRRDPAAPRSTSRVVPAMVETIAASRRASAFSRLDLPVLGAPASTTRKPRRGSDAAAGDRAVCLRNAGAAASIRSIAWAGTLGRHRPRRRNPSTASMIAASARASCSARPRTPNLPCRQTTARKACRRCASVSRLEEVRQPLDLDQVQSCRSRRPAG